jgi:DNA topoisomerase-1
LPRRTRSSRRRARIPRVTTCFARGYAVEDEFTRLEKERGTGSRATLKQDKVPEKLVEEIDMLEEKIKAFKLQMVDREAGKEVVL